MIGWIDFSSEHREKVRTVIDLLKKPGVVDELGIGVIRDALADRMFPGVSTIQTRAKYFTLLAAIVRDYFRKNEADSKTQTLEKYLRYWEKVFRVQLSKRYGDEGEGLGVIGISFGEDLLRDVQRPASSVYWNGLRRFGFIRTNLSLAEFSRAHSGRRSLQSLLQETKRYKGDDPDAGNDGRAHVRAPEVDADYWSEPAITLTQEEAAYLKKQIVANASDSLLAQVLLDPDATSQLVDLRSETLFDDFVELPFMQEVDNSELRQVAQHAKGFWAILRGAHIRYNLLLQPIRSNSADMKLEEDWDEWQAKMTAFDWGSWSSDLLWTVVDESGGKVKTRTRNFVNRWIDLARSEPIDEHACDEAVRQQEIDNKQRKARLRRNATDEQVRGWVGLSRLDYRLTQVKTIVTDIHRGETGEADPDAGR